MILVSQNLLHYMDLPIDTVLRINLAWVDSLKTLDRLISKIDNEIYIDLPIGRTKPPNNSYLLEDLKFIINRYDNIKYLAISNVESAENLSEIIECFGENLIIVPKIESKNGVDNINNIVSILPNQKIIMLDHDDLFSDLISKGVSPSNFFSYIKKLEDFCLANSVTLLKTRGVIFSDEDKINYEK